MGTKKSVFQPDHVGRPTPNKPGPALTRTHGDGRAVEHAAHVADGMERQYSGGIDPRVGTTPKHQSDLQIHGGMVRQTKSGPAFGGDHASAMDSLSGQVVVPGRVKSAPGWGNDTARSGHPLAKPPGSKNLSAVQPVPGQRSRLTDDPGPGQIGKDARGNPVSVNHVKGKPDADMLYALGRAVLAEAECAPDDAAALSHLGIGTLPPITRSK